jgi:4-amino-4-deoxy-L-arabinose transferase-like glycosyltransferase
VVSVDFTPKETGQVTGFAWRLASLAAYVFWVILTVGGLWLRPPTAPVELELLASAWRMYLDGGAVPIFLGAPDPHVAPLLPWLIAISWKILGVSEVWPRLIASIAGLASLILIGRIASLLWPHRLATPIFSRLLLAGLGGFAVSLTMIEPEMLALPFILLAFHGLSLMWLARPGAGASMILRGQVFLGSTLAALAAGWVWSTLPISLGCFMALFDQTNAPPNQRRWFVETGLLGLGSIGAISLWMALAAMLTGTAGEPFYLLGNGWIDAASEASRREPWTLLLLPVALYPWVCWKTLWQALARHLRETLGTGFRLSVSALIVFAFTAFAGGWQLQGMLPIALPISLLGARLLATQAIRPKDFHALVPGFIALMLGLLFFLMNIIPTAHLDALWRELFSTPLPIWMGGMGLGSGLALLIIAYALTQMSPSQQVSRTLQVSLLPILLMTSLNLEFATNLKPFFDLRPVAERLKAIQDAGQEVAVFGAYRGEFDFVGRLNVAPTAIASRKAMAAWARRHPGGAILTYFDGSPIRLPALPIYRGVARDRFVAIWPASAVSDADSPVLDSQF